MKCKNCGAALIARGQGDFGCADLCDYNKASPRPARVRPRFGSQATPPPIPITYPKLPSPPSPLIPSDNPYQPNILDSFDPPEYEIVEPEWATYVPGYHPNRQNFKIHSRKSDASNAFAFHKFGCILFHLEVKDNKKQWVEVARFYKGKRTDRKSEGNEGNNG